MLSEMEASVFPCGGRRNYELGKYGCHCPKLCFVRCRRSARRGNVMRPVSQARGPEFDGKYFFFAGCLSFEYCGGITAVRTGYGVTIIAAHPRETSRPIDAIDFSGNCCIVLGSEGHGISEQVLAACDMEAAIPMTRAWIHLMSQAQAR